MSDVKIESTNLSLKKVLNLKELGKERREREGVGVNLVDLEKKKNYSTEKSQFSQMS